MDKPTPWYNRIESAIIVVLFSAMLVIMFGSVISRYFFSFVFSWAEQLTRIMFVWVTFCGISLAGLKGAHMRVTAITLILGEERSKYVFWLGDAVCIVFGLVISYYMLNWTQMAFNLNQTFTAVPWMNVGVMYIAGVLGMIAFSLRCTQSLVIRIKEEYSKKSGGEQQ